MGDKALRGNRLTAQGGGRIAGPARRAQESGFYSPDMGMRGKFGYKHGGRTKKVIGGLLRLVPKIIKKIIKKKPPRHKGLDVPGSKGPQIGKYPGIDKAMENIKKSGDIWGPGKAKGGRAGYVIGGAAIKGATKLYKKYKKKKVYPETEDLTHQKGPYVGDVGSERKRAKKIKWEKPDRPKRRDRWKKPPESALPRPKWAKEKLKQRELIPPKRKNLGGINAYQEPLEHFKDRPLGVGGRRGVKAPQEPLRTFKKMGRERKAKG
jgi:hypothetical protein